MVVTFRLLAGENMTRRTHIGVCLRLIDEGRATKHRAVALAMYRPIGRHAGRDAVSLAGCGYRSARVAGIGHHRQAGNAEHVFCRLGHWIKLASVIGFARYLVVDDEASLCVDGRLYVIGRRLWPFADPHRPGIGLALHQSIALFASSLAARRSSSARRILRT